MKSEAFQKDGDYEFDVYTSENKVLSEIGAFDVELLMSGREPITHGMLDRADELADFGRRHAKEIRELIFSDYQECRQGDPDGLRECDVPLDVEKGDIMKYVRRLTFTVRSDSDLSDGYESTVHIIPDWKRENALCLLFENSRFTVFDPM